jgi:DNA topoisomerase II
VVEDDDDDGADAAPKKKQPAKPKTIEDTYEKLDLREHVLKRPDTYVGSVRKQEEQSYVLESEERGMVLKAVSFAPALYKIFDEILVNAADNFQRDATMDTVKVNIDPLTNTIVVFNNGEGTRTEAFPPTF